MVINIYGTLRPIMGRKNVEIEVPEGATLNDLFAEFILRFPSMQFELMDVQGRLRSDVPVFLNGRNPRLLPAPDQIVLNPSDVLSLFSPISSGRMNVEVLREK